jgi:ATP-dependent 26S proteasome regulatory subunit
LETFTGVCLLTTNHESAIDSAFLRRLSLHVRFETPERSERENLWRAMLPASAPREQIDFGLLAKRYEMSGGYIRNATLRAAFFAADRREAINQRHLDRAARLEYEAIGKIASA